MVQSGKQFLIVEPLCVFFRFVNLQTLREMMGTGDFVDGEPWDIGFYLGSLPQACPRSATGGSTPSGRRSPVRSRRSTP